MKYSVALSTFVILTIFSFVLSHSSFGQTYTDNASNSAYNTAWSNGTNGGTGFAAWSLSSEGVNAGHFKGDPSNASYGMSSTNIGTTAFGMYGHSSQYAYALRNFSSSMGVGDILTFYWSMNWDCGSSGSKGWELKSGNTTVFSANNSNSSTISYGGAASGTISTNYGTSAMLVTITRTSTTQYSVSITRRNTADGTFSATITSSSAIDNIRIYIGNQETNAGQRNMFFNNFQIQKPNQYRSKATGNWSAASTWEISTDGGTTWANAGAAPGSDMYSTITIRNGHTVSQNQNYTNGSNNNIVVESAAILNMSGATGNFQFNTLSVSGTLVRDDIGSVYSGSNITINNGGIYRHAVNGGSLPSITWNSGSTLEITGTSSATSFSAGGIQSFHHVVWNCTGQTGIFSFGGLTTVNGDFTIQSTGASPSATSCLLLTNSTAITTTIGGNLTVSDGFFAPFGGNTTNSSTLNISGNLSISGGTFDIYRPSTNTGTINLSGDFSMSGGTLTKGGAGIGNFKFSKSGTQTFVKSSGTVSGAINFTVNSGSTLSMGTNVLDGNTCTFNLSSGGGLITANVAGITSSGASGSIQVGGTRTYNTGANYTFNGSSAQATGAGFTGATNLTINNSAGVTLTSSASLSGTLSLTNGAFNVGTSNTITVANNGAITATSGSLAGGAAAGTFTFSGIGSITGTIGFNNVNIAGGVNFGSASTINGTLSISAGGFVNTNAPTYATGSTLRYNSGGTYGRSKEWSETTGAGYPCNVTITGNTILNVVNSVNSYKKASGNLTVDAGSTFSVPNLTAGLSGVGVEFLGNIINDGTISLNTGSNTTNQRLKGANLNNGSSNATATINLSGVAGGDLELSGNYVDNANFTANSRAVFFTGTGDQTIGGTASAPFNIDYLIVTKSSGSVQLLKDIETTAFTIVSGDVDLGGNVVSGAGSFTLPSGATLTTSHAGGLNSAIAVTGTKTFTAGANYVFSGATTTPFPSTGSIGNPASVTIDAAVTLNRDIATTSLVINSARTLTLSSAADLTVSGNITNNGGTLKIETGGSLVQSGSTANSGTGTYIAEREMSGSGGSTPNGRFWYMGVPMSGSTSAALNAAGDNRLWYYNESTANYTEITDNTTSLDQTTGYVFRGGADGTYSLSSNSIGNGSTTFDLTRTPGVTKSGFNLLSNPYPSHLSWNALYTSTVTSGTSPLLPSVWYRTNNGSVMLFDTYNVSLNTGTNNNMSQQVTGSIAPFQAFWVRLNEGTSLQMTATNAMRSHGAQNFLTLTPATVRLNISNGIYHDETIVVLNEDLSNDYDYRDSGKEIPSTTVHQIYSLEGTNKVVINGIANALAKDSLKLGVQIPTAGTYSINCTELTFSDMVFLEDKLTGSYLEVTPTTNYSFTSVAGTFNNRFVLHFAPYVPALPGQTAATAIAMPTSNWPQCNNVSTEDQWHAFTATSEAVSIAVNTTTTDIVIELQDGTGTVVAQENAVNGIGNETLNFFGLTAGQTYKVGVRNNISSQPTGTYGICVKSLKRGGCDYGAGPYSLCQYYKATWAGSTGVSYTFTFTGTSGPAEGQTFTRTQNSDICVLSTVTPLLPYGSTYDVTISNTYTLTDGAGNTEQVTVPSNNGCQVVTIAQPQTTLSSSSSCNNGARFRGAVVSSLPWVCGANNWRWRFTEVNPLTMQTVGLPIELNRGAASNYLNLGSVPQLQNGKTYAVETAPMFAYTGTNYNWGPVQYMCIVGVAQGALQDAEQGVAQGSTKDAMQGPSEGASQVDAMVYVTEGNHVNIQLTNTASNTAKRADIYDVTGKLVKSVRLVEGMNEVTLTETAGIFMVRTTVGNQTETTRVFVNN